MSISVKSHRRGKSIVRAYQRRADRLGKRLAQHKDIRISRALNKINGPLSRRSIARGNKPYSSYSRRVEGLRALQSAHRKANPFLNYGGGKIK